MSKHLPIGIVLIILWLQSIGQCPTYAILGKEISGINTSSTLSYEDKLQALYALKNSAEKCSLTGDSTYALLLRSIGNGEYLAHNNSGLAVAFTSQAVNLNNTLKESRSQHLSALCYYSIGYYHQQAKLYRQALAYYDSAIACSANAEDIQLLRMPARQNKAYLCFFIGDYAKSVEECVLGIKDAVAAKDSVRYLILLNIKAQSLCFENSLPQATADAKLAIQLATALKDTFELAAALKTSGFIAEKNRDFAGSKDFYTRAIAARKHTGDIAATASDYNDLGNFFQNSIQNYSAAKSNYLNAVSYARQINDPALRASQLALAYSNLGDNSFKNNRLSEAVQYYTYALRCLNIQLPDYLWSNPPEAQLRKIEHKELVYNLLTQKTILLLQLFRQQQDAKYLTACLQTALLTDSVITHTRYELTNESSKLFWRNNTRQFFATAMEATYLAGDAKLAFYFMEKSRAVLLTDKLNELGALAHLPPSQAAKEEMLQTNIIAAEQQLSLFNPSSKEYAQAEYKYLNEKQALESFILSLEKNYPAYYQYKYADNVPTLASLQQYLAVNHQSFVHYFMSDTVMYALGITPDKTTFIRLSQKDFDNRQLAAFISLCSNKEKLNSSYDSFSVLAQHIYDKLFSPLQLPKGNTAICTDNFLIPFEALCTDAAGEDFLLYHYSFCYVYSASIFMKPFVNSTAAAGNFVGFAPVAFARNLQLVPLRQSANALSELAGFYSHPALFTAAKATRNSFIQQAANYAVITIFSHARADTGNREPVLYMQDSAIYLSELQLLQKTSAQFALLSACQTNIGKAATGEGIYSLARGFAAAGIPSIAGTLWKADDQAIYRISVKFNEGLAAGMDKSTALQKAKLWFIQNNDNKEHNLPYYWANLVLIGNPRPVVLAKENNTLGWIAALIGGITITAMVVWIVKRKGSRRSGKVNVIVANQQLIQN
ncbi:CHAT domain-containing protein [Ilyomonas limi]|uniref:CHAT domain-containing protein n=1 Tax=Ilyomonas limi TaxID=2575867 RepID=A0A4V5UU20_9BACT|nr:CHAT domain-containing protein [Ilyomonas limi]TKK67263.1 CHAT domain-containing protein [Ilyomonas limi]